MFIKNYLPPLNKKIAVGLSGGVDSSVAAALLVEKGYKVVGVHFKFWGEEGCNKCCGGKLLEACRQTVENLKIPFYEIDLKKEFKRKVVDEIVESYKGGLTPNPCILCNKFVRFGEGLSEVRKLGCEYLATGHYARIIPTDYLQSKSSLISAKNLTRFSKHGENGALLVDTNFYSVFQSRANQDNPAIKSTAPRCKQKNTNKNCISPGASGHLPANLNAPHFFLLTALDKTKDQSYFLSGLSEEQLRHCVFPLGELTKKEVWEMAKERGLKAAESQESFDVCFTNNLASFVGREIGGIGGKGGIGKARVVNNKGDVLGEHRGLWNYTVGERGGWDWIGAAQKRYTKNGELERLYVVETDVKNNTLIVGNKEETRKKEFSIFNFQFSMNSQSSIFNQKNLWVKIRSSGKMLRVVLLRSIDKKNFSSNRTRKESTYQSSQGRDAVNIKKEYFLLSPHKTAGMRIVLEKPEMGIAPGQRAVFYTRLKIKEQRTKIENCYTVVGNGEIY